MKPEMSAAQIEVFLTSRYGSVTAIEALAGGEFSRAFAFTTAERDYVVRFNAFRHWFERDAFAWRHLASPAIPIPRIVAIGDHDGVAYAVSERLPGTTLAHLSEDAYLRLLPTSLDVLDRIHATDIGATTGFGDWDVPGTGRYASWHDYLLSYVAAARAAFHGETASGGRFADPALWRRAHDHVARLAALAHPRALLHGDYGHDNVLADGARITGVLDWARLSYGDVTFDHAWTLFWRDLPAVAPLLRARYGGAPAYDERLLGSLSSLGLDALRFFAEVGREESWDWAHRRLVALLGSFEAP